MELIYYMHNRGVPRDALSPERLQFRDLTLVFGGELRYLIDNREILLRPGDAVYIREGEERARKALENCDYLSFNFRPDERETLPELPVYIPDGMTNEIRLLLSACDEIRDRMTEDADRLALILECILRQIAVNLLPRQFRPLTLRIRNYIAEHLHETITLRDVGKAAFFSPAYCSSVFRRETGMSIVDYAIDEKMKEAKKLIIEGLPLKRVAEMLGFSDYNYFSRTFKKRFSYSPLQYRNSLL